MLSVAHSRLSTQLVAPKVSHSQRSRHDSLTRSVGTSRPSTLPWQTSPQTIKSRTNGKV